MPTRSEQYLAAGFTEGEILAHNMQERRRYAAAGFRQDEIDKYLGPDIRTDTAYTNAVLRSMLANPDNVPLAIRKEDREMYNSIVEGVLPSQKEQTKKKFGVALYMSKVSGTPLDVVFEQMDVATKDFFGETIKPEEAWKRLGEIYSPKQGEAVKGEKPVKRFIPEGQIDPELLMAEMQARSPMEIMARQKLAMARMEEVEKERIANLTGEDFLNYFAEQFTAEAASAEQEGRRVPLPDAVRGIMAGAGAGVRKAAITLDAALVKAGDLWADMQTLVGGSTVAHDDQRMQFHKIARKANELRRQIEREDVDGEVSRYLFDLSEQASMMALGTMAGGGTVVGVMGWYGAQEAADSYMAMKELEIDDSIAVPFSVINGSITGGIEGIFDVFGGKGLIKSLPGMRGMIQAFSLELLEEGLQAFNGKTWTAIASNLNNAVYGTEIEADGLGDVGAMAKDSIVEMLESAKIVGGLAVLGGGGRAAVKTAKTYYEMRQLQEAKREAYKEEWDELEKKDAAFKAAQAEAALIPSPLDLGDDPTQSFFEEGQPTDRQGVKPAADKQNIPSPLDLAPDPQGAAAAAQTQAAAAPAAVSQNIVVQPDVEEEFDWVGEGVALPFKEGETVEAKRRVVVNQGIDNFQSELKKTKIKYDPKFRKELSDTGLGFYIAKEGEGGRTIDQWLARAAEMDLADANADPWTAVSELMHAKNIMQASQSSMSGMKIYKSADLEIGEIVEGGTISGAAEIIVDKDADGNIVTIDNRGQVQEYPEDFSIQGGTPKQATPDEMVKAQELYGKARGGDTSFDFEAEPAAKAAEPAAAAPVAPQAAPAPEEAKPAQVASAKPAEAAKPKAEPLTAVEQMRLDALRQANGDPEVVEEILEQADEAENNDIIAAIMRTEYAKAGIPLPDGKKWVDGDQFKNVRLRAARILNGLKEVPMEERKTAKEAMLRVLESGMNRDALGIAQQIIDDPNRLATADESMAMELRLEELEDQLETAMAEERRLADNPAAAASVKAEAETLRNELGKITEAGLRAGTRAGQALASRRWKTNRRGNRTWIMIVAEATAAKGAPLLPAELADLQEKHAQVVAVYEAAQKQIEVLQAELDAKTAELAMMSLREEASTVIGKRKKSKILASRMAILKEIKKLVSRGVFDVSSTVPMSIEMYDLLLRLARTYVEEGITDMTMLSDRMMDDVPELTQKDIFEVLANRKRGALKRAQSDMQMRMKELKKQAKLELDLIDLKNGLLPAKAVRRSKAEVSSEVKALQEKVAQLMAGFVKIERDRKKVDTAKKKLDEINSQIENLYRNLPETMEEDSAELSSIKEAIREAAAFMSVQDKIAIAQDEMRTGVGAETERAPRVSSERLEIAREELAGLRKELKAAGGAKIKRQEEKLARARARLDNIEKQIDEMYRDIPEKSATEEKDDRLVAIEEKIAEARKYMATIDRIAKMRDKEPKAQGNVVTSARIEAALEEERNLRRQMEIEEQIQALTEGRKKSKVKKTPREYNAETKRMMAVLQKLKDQSAKTEINEKRLDRLIAKINTAEQKLGNLAAAYKKDPTADLDQQIADAREALREVTSFGNAKEKLAMLQERIDNEDWSEYRPERRVAIASDRLDEIKAKIRPKEKLLRDAIESLKPRTPGQRVFDTVESLNQAIRMLQASGEGSFTLRQMLFPLTYLGFSGKKGIKAGGAAFTEAAKVAFSQERFDLLMTGIYDDPRFVVWSKAGLKISDPDGPITQSEEFFSHRVGEVLTRTIGKAPHVRASERHAIAIGNLARIAAFETAVQANPQWTQEQRKAWAKLVNAMSGASNMKMLTSPLGMKFLGLVFYAPNFAASRIEAPGRAIGMLFNKGMRKEAAKVLAGIVAPQAVLFGLARLMGLTVGDDWEEFDIGRIWVGNSAIDLMAGLNQPGRAIIISILYMLDEMNLRPMTNKQDAETAWGKFAKNKIAPLPSFIWQELRGKDFFGRPKHRGQIAFEQIMPMFLSEVYDAAWSNWYDKEEMMKATGVVGTAAFFGGGTAVMTNPLLTGEVMRIYKKVGMAKIERLSFPPEMKRNREMIAAMNKAEAAFNAEVAGWLLKNSNKTKDQIREKVSEIRKKYMEKIKEKK